MSVNQNMANREVCDLTFVNYKTKVPVLVCDYANTTTTDKTGETVYAYGGRGYSPRIPFSGKNGGTLKIETQIQPFQLYSIMSGAAIETSANFIKKETATTTTEAPTITLTGTPATGSPCNVFVAGTMTTVVPATLSGTTVTLTTPTPGTYDVYYVEAITTNVKKLSIKNTTFPKAFTIYAETINKTENDEVLPYKMVYYKAVPQPNFTLTNSSSGDPTTLSLTLDLFSNGDGNMLDMILIEEDQDAEDQDAEDQDA